MPRSRNQSAKTPVICVRVPLDVATAIRARADAEDTNLNELLAQLLKSWVYNEAPTVDDGYRQGRNAAMRVAHLIAANSINQMPSTYEEAMALLAGYSPGGG